MLFVVACGTADIWKNLLEKNLSYPGYHRGILKEIHVHLAHLLACHLN